MPSDLCSCGEQSYLSTCHIPHPKLRHLGDGIWGRADYKRSNPCHPVLP